MKKTILFVLLALFFCISGINLKTNSNTQESISNLNFISRTLIATAENAQCPCDENKDEMRFTIGVDICWCVYSYQDCCCCSE